MGKWSFEGGGEVQGGLGSLFSCVLSFVQIYMIAMKLDGVYNITWTQTFYPTLGTLVICCLFSIIALISGKIDI